MGKDKKRVNMGAPGYLGTITLSRDDTNNLSVGLNLPEDTSDEKLAVILAATINALYNIGCKIGDESGIDFERTVEAQIGQVSAQKQEPSSDTEEGDIIGSIG